jgi:hypothetical protein
MLTGHTAVATQQWQGRKKWSNWTKNTSWSSLKLDSRRKFYGRRPAKLNIVSPLMNYIINICNKQYSVVDQYFNIRNQYFE